MHLCQVNTHVCIAFVGAHDKFPGLCNSKVNPRDRNLGAKEFFPQVNSCSLREVGWILVAFFRMQFFMKKFGNLAFLQVNCREDNVAGGLVEKLDNALPKVGVHHFDALLLQVGIEVALLGKDGFTFDDSRTVLLLEDFQYQSVVFFTVRCPVDDDSIFRRISLKFFQVTGKIGEDVVFDTRG